MKCCIIKDLLPGYVDGLTSRETNTEIQKHLKGCVSCRTAYEQMSAVLLEECLPMEKEADFLRLMKERMRKKYVAAILLTFVFVSGLMIFLKTYDLPIPYDPECMTTEIYQMAYVPNSFGLREWRSLDVLEPDQREAAAAGAYETMEALRLLLTRSVGSDGITSAGRTIQRNGENVRVIYYCYTTSLWNRLFSEENRFVCRSTATGAVYERLFQRSEVSHYEQEQREIYYLPMGNMNRLERLSDEEFDALREKAALVFRGEI